MIYAHSRMQYPTGTIVKSTRMRERRPRFSLLECEEQSFNEGTRHEVHQSIEYRHSNRGDRPLQFIIYEYIP